MTYCSYIHRSDAHWKRIWKDWPKRIQISTAYAVCWFASWLVSLSWVGSFFAGTFLAADAFKVTWKSPCRSQTWFLDPWIQFQHKMSGTARYISEITKCLETHVFQTWFWTLSQAHSGPRGPGKRKLFLAKSFSSAFRELTHLRSVFECFSCCIRVIYFYLPTLCLCRCSIHLRRTYLHWSAYAWPGPTEACYQKT